MVFVTIPGAARNQNLSDFDARSQALWFAVGTTHTGLKSAWCKEWQSVIRKTWEFHVRLRASIILRDPATVAREQAAGAVT